MKRTCLVWALCAAASTSVMGAAPHAGAVWMIKGEVRAADESGADRSLRLGDGVRNGENLVAGSDAEAVLRMADGAMLALRPNSQFRIDQVKKPDLEGAAFGLTLLKGGLRIITGLTGRKDPGAYKVKTATATIGIRGTDHEPFVLPTGVQIGRNPAGTYDKVNSGSTVLKMGDGQADLQPGQVGFARDTGSTPDSSTRALATLLRPVILRYVPEFFKSGTFDAQMVSDAEREVSSLGSACDSGLLARQWLGALDNAVNTRRSDDVLKLFDPNSQVVVRSVASATAPSSSYRVPRGEFVDSVIQSIRDLESFSQVRHTIGVKSLETDKPCDRLEVTSEVSESGRAAGRHYSAKSIERYELRRVSDGFVATAAEVQPAPDR